MFVADFILVDFSWAKNKHARSFKVHIIVCGQFMPVHSKICSALRTQLDIKYSAIV